MNTHHNLAPKRKSVIVFNSSRSPCNVRKGMLPALNSANSSPLLSNSSTAYIRTTSSNSSTGYIIELFLQIRPRLAVEPFLQIRPQLTLEPLLQIRQRLTVEPFLQIWPRLTLEPFLQIRPRLILEPFLQIRPRLILEPFRQIRPRLILEPFRQSRHLTPALNSASSSPLSSNSTFICTCQSQWKKGRQRKTKTIMTWKIRKNPACVSTKHQKPNGTMGLTHKLAITSKRKKKCFMNTKSKKLTQFKELGQNCTTENHYATTLRHHKDGWLAGWLAS